MNPFVLWLKDTGERALSTLVQSLIIYTLAAQGSGMASWKALVAAVFPAVGTVLLNALTFKLPLIANYWLDLIFRIVRTFLVTVLGSAVASTFDLFQWTGWKAVFIAGGSAVLVVVKSEIAKRRSNTISPASFVHR